MYITYFHCLSISVFSFSFCMYISYVPRERKNNRKETKRPSESNIATDSTNKMYFLVHTAVHLVYM